MDKTNDLTVPEKERIDHIRSTVITVLDECHIPVIPSLIEHFAPNPYERRERQWMKDVTDRLNCLEKAGKVSLHDLSNDEEFLSACAFAKRLMYENHHNEVKRIALLNAIESSAVGDVEDAETMMFLRHIEEFTPFHIVYLSEIRRNYHKPQSQRMDSESFEAYVNEHVFHNNEVIRDRVANDFFLMNGFLCSENLDGKAQDNDNEDPCCFDDSEKCLKLCDYGERFMAFVERNPDV